MIWRSRWKRKVWWEGFRDGKRKWKNRLLKTYLNFRQQQSYDWKFDYSLCRIKCKSIVSAETSVIIQLWEFPFHSRLFILSLLLVLYKQLPLEWYSQSLFWHYWSNIFYILHQPTFFFTSEYSSWGAIISRSVTLYYPEH